MLGFFFFSFFRGLADFIAFRRERVCGFFRQRYEINALHVAIDIREFLIAKSWFEIARGSEQQIFSVIAEDRFARTVPTIGDGGPLFVRQRVQVNARHVVFFGARPSNPLTVGRPVITLDLAEFVLVDQGHRLGRNIDIAQPLQAIAPEQLFAVGRPFRRVVVGVAAIRDLLRLAFAVLRTHIQFVLAGRVRVVRNPFSVGRPNRIAFVCA